MSNIARQSLAARPDLARQIPGFVLVGALGFCVDAGLTWLFARWLGAPALLARPPAFAIATLVNFSLNRAFTFQATQTRVLPALMKYVMVCAGGAVVNYAVYALCLNFAPLVGIATTPNMLPLFVACGSLCAMVLTFLGFRSFAFRD